MEASFCAWDILYANLIRGIMNGEEEGEHYRATTLHFVKSLLIALVEHGGYGTPSASLQPSGLKASLGR
jgi:hypothetical protein